LIENSVFSTNSYNNDPNFVVLLRVNWWPYAVSLKKDPNSYAKWTETEYNTEQKKPFIRWMSYTIFHRSEGNMQYMINLFSLMMQ